MGADGGSIPDRRDLVKTKAKAEQTDKALLRELFFLCALSKRPLSRPVVLDPLGKLYNKDAVIEYFIDRSKYGDGDQICGYLKGVKDLMTLNLTPNPSYTPSISSTTADIPSRAPFVCPLSLKEMSGTVPFIALRPCGCVFSDAAIRAVIPNLTKGSAASAMIKDDKPDEAKPVTSGVKEEVACPNCGKPIEPTKSSTILPINPPREVQELLLDNLLASRAAAKSSKKRKATSAIIEATTVSADTEPVKKAARPSSESPVPRHSASPAPGGRATSAVSQNSLVRSVHEKLAEQEQKRLVAQAGMSDAVKAMFKPKGDPGQKRSGMDDFFGRTFTRYA
ncbi:Rtf2 RING-finger-domain-containing protein [Naematelia encephala]|uniref:Rtf2 RING-finger-domain-containing protein n=1 Tax=Naematelia encephala TaxID=71784 RepID=A0A1Y2BDQ6_9TREE|nr:Rtf2 RING-finger-domain-containing protein [Naematelia encephala]